VPSIRPGFARAVSSAGPSRSRERMTPYLWGLFFMLASATLFDGFDNAI